MEDNYFRIIQSSNYDNFLQEQDQRDLNNSKLTIENINNEISTPNTGVLLYSATKEADFTIHEDVYTP